LCSAGPRCGAGEFQFLPLVFQLAFEPLAGALHQEPFLFELAGRPFPFGF